MGDNSSLFAKASEAAARGDKLTAKNLLDELVFSEPNNELAWLLLAEVVEDSHEECDCLQHVLAINPKNTAARQSYDDLLRRFPVLWELDPVKIAADKAEKAKAEAAEVEAAEVEAAEVEAAKKKAEADHDSRLDLDTLDDSPLFDDEKPLAATSNEEDNPPVATSDEENVSMINLMRFNNLTGKK